MTLIICLGRNLLPDETLDWILQERVKQSVRVFESLANARLLFTGKYGHKGNAEPKKSQAQAMFDYAKGMGSLNESKVILEEESESTIHQFYLIKTKILIPQKIRKIHLVTDEIHMPRALMTLKGILGEDFKIISSTSDVRIGGGWRSLIEDSEKRLLEMTEKDLYSRIPLGDHEAWYKFDKEFRELT